MEDIAFTLTHRDIPKPTLNTGQHELFDLLRNQMFPMQEKV